MARMDLDLYQTQSYPYRTNLYFGYISFFYWRYLSPLLWLFAREFGSWPHQRCFPWFTKKPRSLYSKRPSDRRKLHWKKLSACWWPSWYPQSNLHHLCRLCWRCFSVKSHTSHFTGCLLPLSWTLFAWRLLCMHFEGISWRPGRILCDPTRSWIPPSCNELPLRTHCCPTTPI